MTATAPAPSATSATEPAGHGFGGFWRRNRVGILVALALLLALAVAVWANLDSEEYDAPLDPQNPGAEGARAVARVLEDEGVDVEIVRFADALADAGVGGDTTVVVTSTNQLAPSTIRRMRRDTSGARVVLVDPPYHLLGDLQEDLRTAYAPDDTRGSCADERYDDLTITVDDATAYTTASGCFPGDERAFVLGDGRGDTVFFGAGEALTNDQVLRGDNAAVALRLLGQDGRLVWYVPTYEDAEDGEAVSVWTFAPDWLVPALWATALAGVGLVLWRFRRLGPLVSEPLPVVVRAVETTLSRGRMYRRSNDRAHASAALRSAARRRAADRLGLGRAATEADVVAAVAHHLGRQQAEVAALLATDAPVPGTDQELVALGQALNQLDREVRRG